MYNLNFNSMKNTIYERESDPFFVFWLLRQFFMHFNFYVFFNRSFFYFCSFSLYLQIWLNFSLGAYTDYTDSHNKCACVHWYGWVQREHCFRLVARKKTNFCFVNNFFAICSAALFSFSLGIYVRWFDVNKLLHAIYRSAGVKCCHIF